MTDLQKEIAVILNKASRENQSNTPDFILAEYLIDCLRAFENATNERNRWFGEKVKHGDFHLVTGEVRK